LSVASACPTAKWFNASGPVTADTPATTAFSIQVARSVRALRRQLSGPPGSHRAIVFVAKQARRVEAADESFVAKAKAGGPGADD
jgi:hypothetical protein